MKTLLSTTRFNAPADSRGRADDSPKPTATQRAITAREKALDKNVTQEAAQCDRERQMVADATVAT